MTRETDNPAVVSLSKKDWVGILSVVLALGTVLTAAYLRHDRYLTELLVKQEYQSAQQVVIQERIDQIERELRGIN